MFPKAKKLKVIHSFMMSAKKIKNSDPTQQPSDVDHPSVLQWTIIITLLPAKNDVLEFFPKTLAIRSTHLYNSLNAQYLPAYNKTDRKENTC